MLMPDPCLLISGGGVAQLGERLLCKQEVIGSNPFTSTTGRRCRAVGRAALGEDCATPLRGVAAGLIEGCRESCDVTEADRPGRAPEGPREVSSCETAGSHCVAGHGMGLARWGLALCAAVVRHRR